MIICSPIRRPKSFHKSHSSLKDRDRVITSGSASSPVPVMALVHLHPSLSELIFLYISFSVQGQLILVQVGPLVQLQYRSAGFG